MKNGCPHSRNTLKFGDNTILLFLVIGDLSQRNLVIWPVGGYIPRLLLAKNLSFGLKNFR